jgi:hypothetical protein
MTTDQDRKELDSGVGKKGHEKHDVKPFGIILVFDGLLFCCSIVCCSVVDN